MKSPKIIYLINRAHGLRQHLLKSEDYIRMLKAENILEIFDFLLESDYSTELSRISVKELDASQLEEVFYQKLSERFYFLLQTTSGKTRELLENYCEQIGVENLKRTIRAMHGKEKIGEKNVISIPRRYQIVNFSALLKSRTMREIIDLLKETPYKSLEASIDLYEKYDNPLILEAQVDKMYYHILFEKLEKTVDKDEIKQLIGTEIDVKNLLHILSFKCMNVEPEFLKEMVIDISYKLPKRLIPQIISAAFETIPKFLTWPPYAELAGKAVELLQKDKFTETENIFLRYLYSCAKMIVVRNPNNLVYAFAYLHLCFTEARNLTTLIVGKKLGLNQGEIHSSLFL